VVGTVEEELSSLEKVAAVEPYPEEGHSELAPVRASVADGADGGKLAGASEELACLPAGALARRRGEGAPGQRRQGVSSRGAEQGVEWSGDGSREMRGGKSTRWCSSYSCVRPWTPTVETAGGKRRWKRCAQATDAVWIGRWSAGSGVVVWTVGLTSGPYGVLIFSSFFKTRSKL
jgi:hypothetical protein